MINAERFHGSFGRYRKQAQIAHLVMYLLFGDEIMFGIHGNLNVVADTDTRVWGHGSRIGVSQR